VAKATGKELVWDTTKPKGDAKRLMDMTRASGYGFACEVNLDDGIAETIEWYKHNKAVADARYNAFTEKAHMPTGKAA
jgi:nucleoside-diphosphate-sugar epimerase